MFCLICAPARDYKKLNPCVTRICVTGACWRHVLLDAQHSSAQSHEFRRRDDSKGSPLAAPERRLAGLAPEKLLCRALAKLLVSCPPSGLSASNGLGVSGRWFRAAACTVWWTRLTSFPTAVAVAQGCGPRVVRREHANFFPEILGWSPRLCLDPTPPKIQDQCRPSLLLGHPMCRESPASSFRYVWRYSLYALSQNVLVRSAKTTGSIPTLHPMEASIILDSTNGNPT